MIQWIDLVILGKKWEKKICFSKNNGIFSQEIYRASRLVVDTGIHALGWSKEKALQYMLDHTASPEAKLRSEITRYITWPGQATAYKVRSEVVRNM